MALTALVIGSALLMLVGLWHQAGRFCDELPASLQDRLPLVGRSRYSSTS